MTAAPPHPSHKNITGALGTVRFAAYAHPPGPMRCATSGGLVTPRSGIDKCGTSTETRLYIYDTTGGPGGARVGIRGQYVGSKP